MFKIGKLSILIIPKSAARLANSRNITRSSVKCLDQRWRESRGLTENPNAFGPLQNLPDFTYLDGRPTPLGSNQKKRLIKQREIAAKIVTMNGELDFAKKRYARIKAEAQKKRQEILDSKLKPKGHLLLKQNKPDQ